MRDIRLCFFGWLVIVCVLMLGDSAVAQRNLTVTAGAQRHALVIGNDSYARIGRLDNARADARAMAAALEQAGFSVILKLDAGRSEMLETVRQFKLRLSGGSEAVFFFAGHGVQLASTNYLLPTDISAGDEDQVKDDSLPLQRVLDDMTEQKVRFSLAIVDACRDNPFPRTGGRSIGATRGLAPTTAATGQMVIYSAGAGQRALDRLDGNDRNPNGLFTRLFLQEMLQPVSVDRVLRGVRDKVVSMAKSVGHEQVPALYDQTIGEFYFRNPGAGAQASTISPSRPEPVRPATNAVVTPPRVPPESAASAGDRREERALWETVRDSSSASEVQVYLDQYPKGIFAGEARRRIAQLNAAKPAPQPVVAASAPTPSPATTAIDLSGVWRELYPNAGTLMQLSQSGNTFRYVARSVVSSLSMVCRTSSEPGVMVNSALGKSFFSAAC